MKAGFIGLGVMGRPMAKRLTKAGINLTVFDMVPEAVAELMALGAAAAKSAAEVAAAAAVIFTSLPNSAIFKAVMSGEGGVMTGIKPGALAVDLSSVEPQVSRQLAEVLATKGCTMLDAPVSGGVSGAEAGTLTIMVGGRTEDLERAKPLLGHLGNKIFHVGGQGAGQAIKLVNNLLLGINMAAVAEALTLGTKLGLEAQTMLDIISQSSGSSYALTAKAEKFILPGKFDPGFTINLQYKDLELAVSTAKSLTYPLPMGNQAQQIYETARAKGQGREDISSVIKINEDLAGVKVRS